MWIWLVTPGILYPEPPGPMTPALPFPPLDGKGAPQHRAAAGPCIKRLIMRILKLLGAILHDVILHLYYTLLYHG